jgi:type II secretory pathway component PulC
MRLVGILLFAATQVGSIALADDVKPEEPKPEVAKVEIAKAKIPLRIVRMLPETHQALLFDRSHGTYVLAEIDGTVAGYRVEDIDDDEVTLAAAGTEVVLSAPTSGWKKPHQRTEADDSRSDPPPHLKQATQNRTEPAPQDPYAEPEIREVEAPLVIDPAEAGIGAIEVEAPDARMTTASGHPASGRPVSASPVSGRRVSASPVFVSPESSSPVAARPMSASPMSAGVVSASPVSAGLVSASPLSGSPVAGGSALTPGPASGGVGSSDAQAPLIMSRAELNASIADFTKLASSIRAVFTPAGVRVDAIGEGSLFARVGLHLGDTVTAVDGRAIHSIDDAADLYARASTTRSMNVQVVRGGKALTLRLTIR